MLLFKYSVFQIKLHWGIFGISLGGSGGKTSDASSGERSGTKQVDSASSTRQKQSGVKRGSTKDTSKTSGTQQTSGSQKTSGSQTTKGTTATSGSTTGQTTNKVEGVAATNLQQTLSNLDANTQQQLTDIISSLGSADDVQLLQDALSSRALEADDVLGGKSDAIIESARRSGSREIVAGQTRLSKAAGSSQNSLVEQIGLEAQVDLDTELAALENSLFTQNRQIATDELQGALGGEVGNISSIANILKGAQQTTQQEQSQTTGQTSTGSSAQQNQATQVVDSATLSESEQQTAQLVSSLQEAINTGNSTEIQNLVNQLSKRDTSRAAVNENFASRGTSRSKNASFGFSGGL